MKAGYSYMVFIFLWSVSISWSQADSIDIPEITIKESAYRSENIGGQKSTFGTSVLDSLQPLSIVSLLSREDGIYFKNYGPQTLSTPSVRGGSAGHTLVLWNGMPISSPMLGLLDFSLLPVESMDKVTMIKGGNSSLWGSGAIGGVIDMKNEAKFRKHQELSLHSSYGSWNSWKHGVKAKWSNDNFYSESQIQYLNAENDFPYKISEQSPVQTLDNAQARKLDLLQHFGYKITGKSRLTLHYWRQSAERQIPPTIVQNSNSAYQEDVSNRAILGFQHNRNKGVLKMSTAFFRDDIDYYSTADSPSSASSFSNWLNDVTYQHHFTNKSSLFLGVNYAWTRANADGYQDDRPIENKLSFLSSYTYRSDKFAVQASNRLEMVNGEMLPITPQLGIDFTPNRILRISAKLSRDYRIPTLNDRYWRPGGNPDLLAESGWSQELTLAAAKNNKGASITAYNRMIDNWILWIPTEDAFYWSAHNIKEVWSRGLESKIHWAEAISSINYKVTLGHNLMLSTYQFDLDLPDIDKGDQLFYTPKNTFYGKLDMDYKDIHISYHHRYNSSAIGVSENVDAYQVGSVNMDYRWETKDINSKIYFKLENIWNEKYYVVERRPMPGRHIIIGINININK